MSTLTEKYLAGTKYTRHLNAQLKVKHAQCDTTLKSLRSFMGILNVNVSNKEPKVLYHLPNPMEAFPMELESLFK